MLAASSANMPVRNEGMCSCSASRHMEQVPAKAYLQLRDAIVAEVELLQVYAVLKACHAGQAIALQ